MPRSNGRLIAIKNRDIIEERHGGGGCCQATYAGANDDAVLPNSFSRDGHLRPIDILAYALLPTDRPPPVRARAGTR